MDVSSPVGPSRSDVACGELDAVDLLASRKLTTRHGEWTEYCFRYSNEDVIAISHGDLEAPGEIPTRVHSTCFAAHYLESVECDCREQLEAAFALMAREGRGIVVILDQDGRGNGHAALMRAAYTALGYPADPRSFDAAALVLRFLRVKSAHLLTSNPRKIEALRDRGLAVRHSRLVVSDGTAAGQAYYRHKSLEGYLVRDDESYRADGA